MCQLACQPPLRPTRSWVSYRIAAELDAGSPSRSNLSSSSAERLISSSYRPQTSHFNKCDSIRSASALAVRPAAKARNSSISIWMSFPIPLPLRPHGTRRSQRGERPSWSTSGIPPPRSTQRHKPLSGKDPQVRAVELESTTYGLKVRCSTN